MKPRFLLITTGAFLGAMLFPSTSSAQIGGMIRGALNNAAQTKIDNMVNCAVNDQGCINKAHADGKQVTVTDKNGKPLKDQSAANRTSGDSAGAASGSGLTNPDSTAFVNYDFVPGDSVIFAEDFSKDPVGDLPLRLKVLSGNWEIAAFKGQRFLRANSFGTVMIPLPATLPDKFTLELDLIHSWGWVTEVRFVDPDHDDGYAAVTFGSDAGIGEFQSEPLVDRSNQLYHARLMADGEHVKVYVDGKRVANVPEGKLGRANGIWIQEPSSDDEPFYITNIRVAASQKKLFEAISADGRVATHGILFDVNSDRIRAESTPTLKEIGDMLSQHADLKLTIEGHTDNTGTPAGNQSLSERRAASVRQYLIDSYKTDAARLKSVGYGQTKPVGPNDTAEGRQNNRRVELVKN